MGKREADWCDYTGHVDVPRDQKKPKKVRCPACGKRMVPRTLDGEPMGEHFDPYYVIPPHKKPHGRRRPR